MKHLSPAEIETIRVPEPKHDPFTLESLVAWLERQPADGAYCFMSTGGCLLHKYFTAMGKSVLGVGGYSIIFADNPKKKVPLGPSFEDIAAVEPHTFGAALTRARAVLASQKGNANG